jgi:excinuclease UvrABC nuclease subunit
MNWEYLKWGNLKSSEGWTLLPDIFKMIKKYLWKPGVYVIYDDEKYIVYIGSTKNLGKRLRTQIDFYLPHHVKIKVTDDFKELERILIEKLKPLYNVIIPVHPELSNRCDPLSRYLKAEIKRKRDQKILDSITKHLKNMEKSNETGN